MARSKASIPKRTPAPAGPMAGTLRSMKSELRFLPRKESPAEKPGTAAAPRAIPPIQRAAKKPLHGKYTD